jgi:hypothetical protein
MYFYPLSRIHNTSLVSAYFRLDKRKCKCLKFIYLFNGLKLNYIHHLRFIPERVAEIFIGTQTV